MADDRFTSDRSDAGSSRRRALRASNGRTEAAANVANAPVSDAREDGEARRRVESPRNEHSPAALARQLLTDAGLLFRKEIALAASEVSRSIDRTKTGAIAMASAGAVLYAGFLFLLGAAAFALAMVLPLWSAALIVGAATTVVGVILLKAGQSRVSANSFAPDRTIDALRKDSAAMRRQTS